jgi:PAS domain-containing protein
MASSSDTSGVVTHLNPGRRLTGWPQKSRRLPLERVFQINYEETREATETPPAGRCARASSAREPHAAHRCDGTERPIDDSAAPIRDATGRLQESCSSSDVTERRLHDRLVQDALDYADNILATMREPFLVLDRVLRIRTANRSFYENFQVTPEVTQGRLLYDLGNGQWDVPRLRELLEDVLPQNHSFDHFEVETVFPNLGRRTMLLNARRIVRRIIPNRSALARGHHRPQEDRGGFANSRRATGAIRDGQGRHHFDAESARFSSPTVHDRAVGIWQDELLGSSGRSGCSATSRQTRPRSVNCRRIPL